MTHIVEQIQQVDVIRFFAEMSVQDAVNERLQDEGVVDGDVADALLGRLPHRLQYRSQSSAGDCGTYMRLSIPARISTAS